jgi:hypothetical protein
MQVEKVAQEAVGDLFNDRSIDSERNHQIPQPVLFVSNRLIAWRALIAASRSKCERFDWRFATKTASCRKSFSNRNGQPPL